MIQSACSGSNLENISGEVDVVPRDEQSPYHSSLGESLIAEIVDLVHVDVLVADDCPGTVTAEEPFLGHHQVQVEASLGVGGQGGLRGEESVLVGVERPGGRTGGGGGGQGAGVTVVAATQWRHRLRAGGCRRQQTGLADWY